MHHVAIVYVWTMLLTNGYGHTFAVVCQSCEATQPFLGFKWIMDRYKMRSSPIFAANGLTIFFGWWVLRIGGYVTFLGYKWHNNWDAVGSREVPALLCWTAGATLQVMWGYKISTATIAGLAAMFKPGKGDKAKA